jgi:hypothetical protein
MTMATMSARLDVEKLVRVAGVLGAIRAWSENADSDDLYRKETVARLYQAIESSETAVLEVIMQQKDVIASDG